MVLGSSGGPCGGIFLLLLSLVSFFLFFFFFLRERYLAMASEKLGTPNQIDQLFCLSKSNFHLHEPETK